MSANQNVVEAWGTTAGPIGTVLAGRGEKAIVHPGRPVTVGPARCQGCRSLVWWSGALWANHDGTWHRCGS